jgi:predicted ATPase
LAEALAVVDKTGERVYEAELYRLKGELLLAQEGHRLQAEGLREKAEVPRRVGIAHRKVYIVEAEPVGGAHPTREAEACFLKAIDIARKQQAKALELRATVSLARLWQKQGKQKQARKLLADIYGWFTEGFDTKDLQEAKVLLLELTNRTRP